MIQRRSRSRSTHTAHSCEALESRQLLSGVVNVALDDGNLALTGDDADNDVRVTQIVSPDRQGSTLIIRPVNDTLLSYRGQTSDQPLRIENVELDTVKLLPGDGVDDFRMNGVHVEDAVRLENAGGRDFFRLADAQVGKKLEIDSADTMRSVVAGSSIGTIQDLDKSTPDLINAVATQNTSLVVVRSRIHGSVLVSLDGKGGDVQTEEIRFNEVKVDGQLDVATAVPTSVVLNKADVAQKVNVGYKRSPQPDADRDVLPESRLVIRESRVGESLTVEMAQEVNVAVAASQVGSASFKFDLAKPIPAAPSLSIFGSQFRGGVRVAAGDVTGDATDSIEALRVNIRESRVGEGLIVQTAQPLNLNIVNSTIAESAAYIDKSTPILASTLRVKDSTIGGRLRIETTSPLQVTTDGLKAAAVFAKYDDIKGEATDSRETSRLIIRDSEVSGPLRISSAQSIQVVLRESTAGYITIDVKTGAAANKATPILMQTVMSGVNVEDSLRITTSAETNLRMRDVRVGGNMAWIDKSTPDLLLNASLTDTSIGGRLRIQTEQAALNLRANGVSAASGYMKLGSIKGEATDRASSQGSGDVVIKGKKILQNFVVEADQKVRFVLADSEVGGQLSFRLRNSEADPSIVRLTNVDVGRALRIAGSGPLRLNTVNTTVGELFHIETDGAAGTTAQMILRSVQAGQLSIRGGAESTLIRIEDSTIRGRTRIDTGEGDDRLRILDSLFAGNFSADGGLGDDLLIIRGSRFGGRKLLRNWERIVEEPPQDERDSAVA